MGIDLLPGAEASMKASDILDTEAVAEILGVKRTTVHMMVYRKQLPQANGHVSRKPFWFRDVIEGYALERAQNAAVRAQEAREPLSLCISLGEPVQTVTGP